MVSSLFARKNLVILRAAFWPEESALLVPESRSFAEFILERSEGLRMTMWIHQASLVPLAGSKRKVSCGFKRTGAPG